jgi:hypothetical protein
MPLSGGTAPKNLRSASRPPADAPIPTIAKRGCGLGAAGVTLVARTFWVEGRAPRVGRPILARLRPRSSRFISSRAAWRAVGHYMHQSRSHGETFGGQA